MNQSMRDSELEDYPVLAARNDYLSKNLIDQSLKEQSQMKLASNDMEKQSISLMLMHKGYKNMVMIDKRDILE